MVGTLLYHHFEAVRLFFEAVRGLDPPPPHSMVSEIFISPATCSFWSWTRSRSVILDAPRMRHSTSKCPNYKKKQVIGNDPFYNRVLLQLSQCKTLVSVDLRTTSFFKKSKKSKKNQKFSHSSFVE